MDGSVMARRLESMPLDFIAGYVMGSRAAGRAAGMAASAAQFSAHSSNRLYEIDDRIDRLTLVIQAMWSLMEEQGIPEDALRERIASLDAADGRVDGKATAGPVTCPECEAVVTGGAAMCQFCGHEFGEGSPFAAI
jgi:hypothetical protein